MVRHLALSGHNRKLFPKLMEDREIDVFQVRYNAANSGAEKDVFPYCGGENRPGMVSFTATRWGQLLKEKKMPPGEKPLTAVECYRFVLSNPAVDVCMTGARSAEMLRENLETLETGPLMERKWPVCAASGTTFTGNPGHSSSRSSFNTQAEVCKLQDYTLNNNPTVPLQDRTANNELIVLYLPVPGLVFTHQVGRQAGVDGKDMECVTDVGPSNSSPHPPGSRVPGRCR